MNFDIVSFIPFIIASVITSALLAKIFKSKYTKSNYYINFCLYFMAYCLLAYFLIKS